MSLDLLEGERGACLVGESNSTKKCTLFVQFGSADQNNVE